MSSQLHTCLARLARPLRMLWQATLLAGLFTAAPLAGQEGSVSAPPEQLRLAFSIGVIGELNRNDAKASTMVWGRTVLSQRNIVAEAVPSVFDRADDLCRALEKGAADAVTVTADEFLSHPFANPPDTLFLGVRNGKITQQYVFGWCKHACPATHISKGGLAR